MFKRFLLWWGLTTHKDGDWLSYSLTFAFFSFLCLFIFIKVSNTDAAIACGVIFITSLFLFITGKIYKKRERNWRIALEKLETLSREHVLFSRRINHVINSLYTNTEAGLSSANEFIDDLEELISLQREVCAMGVRQKQLRNKKRNANRKIKELVKKLALDE